MELPESSLPALPGVAYASSTDSSKALARTHVGETLSAFSGGIARDLVVGGEIVGGVQVYRFAHDVAAIDYARFVPMMAYTFTGATPTPQRIGGKEVQVVDPVPGSSRAVVAWTAQDHVVILWAHDLASAQDYAGRFILDSV
ncbi:MAG TPA: hypothetical protein VFL59_02815 [Candidatus Nanopelagicales bacterium]|nr:hypothetical protein [Candidatus Nanopelagicales bacterium]